MKCVSSSRSVILMGCLLERYYVLECAAFKSFSGVKPRVGELKGFRDGRGSGL